MIADFGHFREMSTHVVTLGVTDGLELGEKVCLEHQTFISMNRLKLLPDIGSSGLAFDLDKGGAIDGSIDDFLERRFLLLVSINFILVGFQF